MNFDEDLFYSTCNGALTCASSEHGRFACLASRRSVTRVSAARSIFQTSCAWKHFFWKHVPHRLRNDKITTVCTCRLKGDGEGACVSAKRRFDDMRLGARHTRSRGCWYNRKTIHNRIVLPTCGLGERDSRSGGGAKVDSLQLWEYVLGVSAGGVMYATCHTVRYVQQQPIKSNVPHVLLCSHTNCTCCM